LVFTCLIEAGAIDPDAPVYDIARALNIPPVRVRNLILNWQLRSTPQQGDLRDAIVTALKKTRFSGDGKQIIRRRKPSSEGGNYRASEA
jgi:hypothetical protein